MMIYTSFGDFSVGFRYIDRMTIATVVPVEDGRLVFGERRVGAAFYNPKDVGSADFPHDRAIGQELALARAFGKDSAEESYFTDSIDEAIKMFKLARRMTEARNARQ